MCCSGNNDYNVQEKSGFQKYFRALHCPIRWVIIRFIGDEAASTNEIFEGLKRAGENISKSNLYYHLSELEKGGIIELAKYREEGGGAPEKVWRLREKEIKINLLTDLPEVPRTEE